MPVIADTVNHAKGFDLSGLMPKFDQLGHFPSAESITAIFIGAICLVAAVSSVFVIFSYYRSRRNVSFFNKLLKGAERENLAAQYRAMRKEATDKHKDLGNIWNEFHESLVFRQASERVHNTLDAEHFFNTHSLAGGLTDNRLYAAIPGLLTALGVLGTFLGLSLGLASLADISDAGESVEKLKHQVFGMIDGASIAFVTSLWGIGTSFVFNFGEKLLERSIRSRIAKLQRTVDYLFPRITPEHSLVEIQDTSQKTAMALDEMAERIGNRLQEVMTTATESLTNSVVDSLTRVLGPAIDKLQENAAENGQAVLGAMTEKFLEGVQQQGAQQRDALDSAADEVKSAVAGLSDGLRAAQESALANQESMKQQNQEVMENLRLMFDNQLSESDKREEQRNATVAEQLAAQDKLQSQIGNLVQSLVQQGELNKALSDSNSQVVQEMRSTVRQLSLFGEGIDRSLKGISEQIEAASRLTSEAVQSAQSLSGPFEHMLEAVKATQEKLQAVSAEIKASAELSNDGMSHMQGAMDKSQRQLKAHVDELSATVEKMMQDYASAVKGQVVERMSVWNEQTSSFSTAMTKAVRAIESVIDDIDGKLQR